MTKAREIRLLGTDTALLTAIAGIIPNGENEANPRLNAHQIVVSVGKDSEWKIGLFQNMPAQYHGRPELVKEMTHELNKWIL